MPMVTIVAKNLKPWSGVYKFKKTEYKKKIIYIPIQIGNVTQVTTYKPSSTTMNTSIIIVRSLTSLTH